MTDIERELKPVFAQALFSFESPDFIPEHYDEFPNVPNFAGQWAVFGWSGGDKTMDFALDVMTAEQAELLAQAKKQFFQDSIHIYGYSPDVYILDPSGRHRRYSFGRLV
jgi:predicted metalloprotease with PDZ domain